MSQNIIYESYIILEKEYDNPTVAEEWWLTRWCVAGQREGRTWRYYEGRGQWETGGGCSEKRSAQTAFYYDLLWRQRWQRQH